MICEQRCSVLTYGSVCLDLIYAHTRILFALARAEIFCSRWLTVIWLHYNEAVPPWVRVQAELIADEMLREVIHFLPVSASQPLTNYNWFKMPVQQVKSHHPYLGLFALASGHFRICFKTLVITYWAIHGQAPTYISGLLHPFPQDVFKKSLNYEFYRIFSA